MTIRDTSVKFFTSEMTGAPTLSGTAGALITVLDACLVNGFGTVTATSLVVASGIATLTVSGGHGFVNPGAAAGIDVGIVGLVAGVTGSLAALNAEWRVTVTNSTVLTWECGTAIPNGTASGTITIKHAPAGWSKTYSGTNKAAYSRTDPFSTSMLLRVDDSPAQYPTLIMYNTMTDVDTGTGAAPASGVYYCNKSNAASSAVRKWNIFADSRSFYFNPNNYGDGSLWAAPIFFGDIISGLAADAYGCKIVAEVAQSTAVSYLGVMGNATGSLMARDYNQLTGPVAAVRASGVGITVSGRGTIPYPNPSTGGIIAAPVEVLEGASAPQSWRGRMPGLYSACHEYTSLVQGTIINALLGSNTKTLFIQEIYYPTQGKAFAIFDIIGPWR